MATPKEETKLTAAERRANAKTERAANARKVADERRAKKLHAIAERRAGQVGLSKADFIAGIVKGKYRPITAEDIEAEPTPESTPTEPADSVASEPNA
jgi:hypothetical protein